MQTIALIINGSRRLSKQAQAVVSRLEENESLNIEQLFTEFEGHATALARTAALNGASTLVAVGGDGTCNEVVNGILTSEKPVTFAIVPNGTGNDFHRLFGEFNADYFVAALLNGKTRRIDLCQTVGELPRYALNSAGIGFDGHVIQVLSQQRKRWKSSGKFSYATAIVRAFFSFKRPTVKVKSSNFDYEGSLLMLVACNGPVFGHGLTIQPNAKIDDGQLSCVLLGKVSLMDYVRYLSRLKKGLFIEHPEVHYFEASEVDFKLLENKATCQLDGELSKGSVEGFKIVPNALSILDVSY